MKANQLFTLPVILSVLMHTVLLILIAGNWASADKPEEVEYRPHYVNATLVELTPKAIAAPPQPKPQVLENNRQQEQERRQKQERERQQAEAKKQQEKKAQEVKAKAEQDRLNKIKTEQARKKAAEEAKRKAAEEELEQQREAQERLDAALQKEEQFLSDRSDAVTVQSYEAVIRQRIEESWSRPPSARIGMQATLEINMVPTGQVVNVRVIKGSGDIAFDRSAEQAVKRVDRFSEIQGMPNDVFERHFRVFRLLFQPEDLRQ